MKFNQTKKFKKLEKTWYQKLKKQGFKDIEKNPQHLANWTSYTGAGYEHAQFTSELARVKQAYYQLAKDFYNTFKFQSEREKLMFEMHLEGIGYRGIAKHFRTSKFKVSCIMKPLLDQMKAKK